MTSKPRPKVQAAASATTGAVILAFLLRLAGVDVDQVPPEVLLAAAGFAATAAAYLKRDGLAGAWDRIVRGGDPTPPLDDVQATIVDQQAAQRELTDLLRQQAALQQRLLEGRKASDDALASAMASLTRPDAGGAAS